MNNNLSRQLCELCGIEPKKIKKCKAGQGCVDFPGCEGRFGDKTCYIEQTVDFTKPENFVRLFDLPIVNNGTRTVGYFVVYEFTMKTIKEFIECLIIKLERTQFSITKEVKQSIREAEWVYD